MNLSIINTGYFKLDGGAMFGVVPRRLWEKLNPPDENNLCTWALRCLLIQTDQRNILIDTGIGNKQGETFRRHFEPHGTDTLIHSLHSKGLEPEDITDVLLTHLHFDHVGGAVYLDAKGNPIPSFPNATYWTNEVHYNWAMYPNERERASFLQENFEPLRKANVLKFIDVQRDELHWLEGIWINYAYGHTEAMMTVKIKTPETTFLYAADALPSSFHIGMPYVMSYDIRPLQTLTEKEKLLTEAFEEQQVLIFEHDPKSECATLTKDTKGRFSLNSTSLLEQWTK